MKVVALPIIITFFIFTSCSFHSGQLVSLNYGNANTETAIGIASTTKVLGLGGVSRDALLLEAKQNLLKSRPLREGEKYMNITFNKSIDFYFLFSQTKFIITADVKTANKTASVDRKAVIQTGDLVTQKNATKNARVILVEEKKIMVELQRKGKVKYKLWKLKETFRVTGKQYGMHIGEKVKGIKGYENEDLEVVGFSYNRILFRDKNNIEHISIYSPIQ